MTKLRLSRQEPALDPEVARDLALVDALIAGDATVPAAPQDLRDAVVELRAARPAPRDEFARQLDRKMARGFAAGPEGGPNAAPPINSGVNSGVITGSGSGSGRFGRSQWLALGSACAVLLVIAAGTLSLQSDGGGISRESDNRADTTAAAPPQGAMLKGAQPDAAGAGDALPQSEESASGRMLKQTAPARKQVRTASLELAANTADLEDSADAVVATVDRYGGYVQDSSVTGGSGGQAAASFTLQLPAAKFNDALGDLSQIAHVRSRTQNTQDVTGTYDRTKTALADARAQRAGLLKALAKADTEQEVDSIRLRLRGANQRIERIDAKLARLNQRIDFVSLNLSIAATAADPDGSWGVDDALQDAWMVLTAIAGVLIVALAIIAPFALLAAVALLIWRRTRNTRRERTIDSGPPE